MHKQISNRIGAVLGVVAICLLIGGVVCWVNYAVLAGKGGHAGYEMWAGRLFVVGGLAFVASVVCFVVARARRSRPSEP